jgi:hypothetical protein
MQFKPFARYAVASAAALAGCLLFALPASAQVAVTINGGAVDFSPPPIIQAGRVFVPLRGVFEQLGATVVYSNGTINATGNGRNISLQIGSTQATINGQPETIDVAPFIIGASTFVPLRFVSEALGASVNWDNEDRIVSIATVGAAPSYAGNPAPSENYVSYAPPPIPVYEQPYLPAPNYIWLLLGPGNVGRSAAARLSLDPGLLGLEQRRLCLEPGLLGRHGRLLRRRELWRRLLRPRLRRRPVAEQRLPLQHLRNARRHDDRDQRQRLRGSQRVR